MISSNFFEQIFDIYSQVKIRKENKEFYNLSTIVYYLADIHQSIVKAKNVFEIDIRSAFPTICRFLFKDETEFLNKIDELKENKLERNIFISTTLKNTEYLKQLNLISKMIISSILMDADPTAKILELKKDGIVYIGKPIDDGKLFKLFTSEGFQIRKTEYSNYVRYQKTSYYLSDELIIKGIFKDRPEFLAGIAKKILLMDEIDYDELNKIYSTKFFNIIQNNMLDELFVKYYLCNGNKYLDENFRYSKLKAFSNMLDLYPKNYLKLFIYPLMEF